MNFVGYFLPSASTRRFFIVVSLFSFGSSVLHHKAQKSSGHRLYIYIYRYNNRTATMIFRSVSAVTLLFIRERQRTRDGGGKTKRIIKFKKKIQHKIIYTIQPKPVYYCVRACAGGRPTDGTACYRYNRIKVADRRYAFFFFYHNMHQNSMKKYNMR